MGRSRLDPLNHDEKRVGGAPFIVFKPDTESVVRVNNRPHRVQVEQNVSM